MEAGGSDKGSKRDEISRRRFCQNAAIGLGGLAVGYLGSRKAWAEGAGPLPLPIVTGNSIEICMNSRVSRHSGLGGTATDQQIANILWAAGRAPVAGGYRTIYLQTPNAKYIYHPESHSLEYYSSETASNAVRITYDRELDFDAGVSYVLALWASVSLWTGSSSQIASCPQMSDLNFGINAVPGLTSELTAVSSDGSLPNPITDGSNNFEEVLADLSLSNSFRADQDLAPADLSQILWGGYGCSAHMTSNGRGGLTVPSWVGQYYLTNRIYIVDSQISRYCNRVGSNLATRDHRLELVQAADVRAQLRQALPDLPEAPCYILLCLTSTGLATWYQRLETGFAAGGMLAQAGALGLGCAFKAALSATEFTAVQQITQIPTSDYPHAVVALGHAPSDLNAFGACMAGPDVSVDPDCHPEDLDGDGDVDLEDFGMRQRD